MHRIIVKKSIKQIKFYKILKIKLHNIHQNIHYNFRVFPKKKIEPDQWRSWRWRKRLVVLETKRSKRRCTCTTHLWSYVHNNLVELFIIRRELLILLGEISRVLFQGHNLLILGAQYWLGAPNGWDTMSCPQVIVCSVRESVHPIFIGSTKWSCLHPQIQIEIRVGRRIVLVSLPQLIIICLLKIKKKIIIFNSRK